MKERPIPMTGDSVRAIKVDKKTQTRRLWGLKYINAHPDIWQFKNEHDNLFCFKHPSGVQTGIKCPYGKVGDRLWVRETWRIESFMEGEPLLFGYKDGQTIEENEYSDTLNYEGWYERVCIQSTDEAKKAFEQGLVRQDEEGYYRWDIGKSPCRWRPPMFMPRWASRILLEITEVRVERLQDIPLIDVKKEGVSEPSWYNYNSAIDAFADIWNSINGKKYPWDANPWVWVISFRRVK